jgi:hypothetical protein
MQEQAMAAFNSYTTQKLKMRDQANDPTMTTYEIIIPCISSRIPSVAGFIDPMGPNSALPGPKAKMSVEQNIVCNEAKTVIVDVSQKHM